MRMNSGKEKQLSIVDEEFDSFIEKVISNHIRAGQKASGRTMQSIRKNITDEGGVVFARAYFGVLETGRKPGSVPKNFRSVILQWMRDKGINAEPIPYIRKPSSKWQPKYSPQERGDLSLAGAIAYRIRKEGTRLYRNGGRDDIYSNEIQKTVGSILDRIITVFKKDVESININSINEDSNI